MDDFIAKQQAELRKLAFSTACWWADCTFQVVLLLIGLFAVTYFGFHSPPDVPFCSGPFANTTLNHTCEMVNASKIACQSTATHWHTFAAVGTAVVLLCLSCRSWPRVYQHPIAPAFKVYTHGDAKLALSTDTVALAATALSMIVAVRNNTTTDYDEVKRLLERLGHEVSEALRTIVLLEQDSQGNYEATKEGRSGEPQLFTVPITVHWPGSLFKFWTRAPPSTVNFAVDSQLASSFRRADLPPQFQTASEVQVQLGMWGKLSFKVQDKECQLFHSVLGKDFFTRVAPSCFRVADLKGFKLGKANAQPDERFQNRSLYLGGGAWPIDSGCFCTVVDEKFDLQGATKQTVEVRRMNDNGFSYGDVSYHKFPNSTRCYKVGKSSFEFGGSDWLLSVPDSTLLHLWPMPARKEKVKVC
eukprot:TRINITY_DN67988_c3_g6_i3.p1 TRINITY_DN67988_c3_g6~~TRINITY_DN67988_c3_g6_i3.p1  ORF type:complete len:443 (-),score=21.18 TRINITY_DN67988_c3_g6_i3:53-1297(-)